MKISPFQNTLLLKLEKSLIERSTIFIFCVAMFELSTSCRRILVLLT